MIIHRRCASASRLGGYLPRHKDGQPGWLVLWRGWRRLQDMVEYALAAGLEKSDYT
jgi:hypothetical protein